MVLSFSEVFDGGSELAGGHLSFASSCEVIDSLRAWPISKMILRIADSDFGRIEIVVAMVAAS